MYETVCIEITVVVVWSLLFVLSNFSRTHRILLQLDEWYNIAAQSYQASVDSQTSKQVDAIFFILIFLKYFQRYILRDRTTLNITIEIENLFKSILNFDYFVFFFVLSS